MKNNYTEKKGSFIVDCNHGIFSPEEIECLETWGHWFQDLSNGEFIPLTEKQRRFVKVCKGIEPPFSIEETAWHKYEGRKRVEAKYGDKLYYNYMPEEDNFYSWKMYKQQKSMMSKLVVGEHYR